MGTHDIRTRLPARAVVLPTTLIVAVLLGATGVVASVLASLAVDVPVAYLFTDTSDAVVRFGCEGRSCMLAGGLSNVGVLLWAVAAITAVFAACLRPDSSSRKPLLAGGALSALLLADELFRLHDTKLGGSSLLETVIMVGYAGLAVMLVRTAGAWLRGTDVALLVAAFGLLATSVAIDRVASWMGLYAEGGVGILIEDGVKFIGIVCWAFYWTGAAAAALGPDPAGARGSRGNSEAVRPSGTKVVSSTDRFAYGASSARAPERMRADDVGVEAEAGARRAGQVRS